MKELEKVSFIAKALSFFPFADQTGFSSPPPDATKFEPTSILGFPAALIAEQLTKIETVSSLKGL